MRASAIPKRTSAMGEERPHCRMAIFMMASMFTTSAMDRCVDELNRISLCRVYETARALCARVDFVDVSHYCRAHTSLRKDQSTLEIMWRTRSMAKACFTTPMGPSMMVCLLASMVDVCRQLAQRRPVWCWCVHIRERRCL